MLQTQISVLKVYHHYILEEQVATAQNVQKKVDNEKPIILYRNDKNSKEMSKEEIRFP